MTTLLAPPRSWKLILVGMSLLTLLCCRTAFAQTPGVPFVRLAELDVDPARLEEFQTAAREHAEASLRLEPGILALHAAAEKETPGRIRVFEMYVDAQAYAAHLRTPHFQKFRAATDGSILSRRLLDADPVRLGVKSKLGPTPLVRVAELVIDPPQLRAYQNAVSEEIDDSTRIEPGVLAIYAVALRDKPNALRFFEIYADESAYRQHIDSPHFRKYVEVTKAMITSRRLLEMETIVLGLPAR